MKCGYCGSVLENDSAWGAERKMCLLFSEAKLQLISERLCPWLKEVIRSIQFKEVACHFALK